MKKLLGIVVLGLLLSGNVYADDESTLPPCQGEDHTQYVNCYGSYVGKDYSEIYNQPGLTNDYTGEFGNSPGLSHGKGTAKIYENGEYKGEYVGEFKDDKLHGQATYTETDGFKIVGEWKDDKLHGHGTMTYTNGDKYVGEFKDDKFHGQGTFTWANGDKYVGEWKDDDLHGQGIFTFADGEQYVGEFKDGERHGQGTYNYVNGDKYVGEWKYGERHGQGNFIYAEGAIYIGEFTNNKFRDTGTYKIGGYVSPLPPCRGNDYTKFVSCFGSYKKRFVGEYANTTNDYLGEFGNSPGIREGKGIDSYYYKQDGTLYAKYVGDFKDDKLNGKATATFYDRTKYFGEWKDDYLHGQGTKLYPGGSSYVGELKEGLYHGQGILIHKAGDMSMDLFGKEYNELTEDEIIKLNEYLDSVQFNSRNHNKLSVKNGVFNEIFGRVITHGKYVGEFKEGKYNGQGTFIFRNNKSTYIGNWKNGYPSGYGELRCNNSTQKVQFNSRNESILNCKPERIIVGIWDYWNAVDIIKLNF